MAVPSHVALVLAVVCAAATVDRAEAQIQPSPAASRIARAPSAPPQRSVRLNFFNQNWADVLHSVADSSGSQLVMDEDAPRGRFTRQDFRSYTRADAVRILNQELEPQGFRLLERDKFLVLLHVKNLREEYGVPSIPSPSAAQPAAAPAGVVPAQTAASPAATVRPAPSRTAGQTFTVTPAAATVAAPAPAESAVQPDVRALPFYQTSADQPSAALVEVQLRHRTAADVARAVYEAYRREAELVDQGPGQLPAFVVYTSGAAVGRQADYAVGIDEANDQLVIEAARPRAVEIEDLIRSLDVPEETEAKVHRTKTSGRQLAMALQEIADGAVGDAPPAVPPAGADAMQPLPEEPALSEPPPGSAPLRLDLQGPVTIRDVPGVGLVVTGNRADVDAVMDTIDALRGATGEATAGVHLLHLQNVNSEALAELLNSVYEALTELRRPLAANVAQVVRVIPVVKPNAVLILAPEREMESVLKLADELDKPVDPMAELEVFRLKNAVADQVASQLTEFYQERQPLGTRVRAVADVRTNSVVVQARPNDLAEIAGLIEKIDLGTSFAVSRMQVFVLRHATATNLANTINQAIQSVLAPPATVQQGAGQGLAIGGGQTGTTPEELRTPKSAILELVAGEGGVEQLVRSGILADIRVTADTARNALIVSAPEQSMRLMTELIAQLDLPTPLVADIKVFTLKHSDATVTAQLLEDLFTADAQANQLGVQVTGAEDAGSGLIPLRFSVDARTNSVVAIGSADSLVIVEAILARLDESDIRKRQNVVRKLLNAPAADVASALNEFLAAQRELASLDPDLITNLELLEQEVIVVPEAITNSLLISATPQYYDEIIAMVDKLDQKPPEVVIQALLVEVVLDNTDELGVNLGFQDPILFRRSVNGVPGFNFNNLPLGNDVAEPNPSHVGTQGLTDLGLTRINPDLGFGGLVLSASSDAVSVLIRALSAQRTVHILSRPTIRTLDNQPALIQVGQQVPIVVGANVSSLGTYTPTIEQQQVGIILSVTPRISPDGSIVMDTVATRSALSAEGVPLVVDPVSETTIESPVIDITTAQATISVPNGQTIVLGGMITKRDEAFEQKVPWLGDIPYVGLAFRYDGVNTNRTELLIFLTPRVIRNESDSELIKRVEAERLHFVECDAEQIHGPLYSAPPPCPPFGPGVPMTPDPAYPGGMPEMAPHDAAPAAEQWDRSGAPTSGLPMSDGSVRPLSSGRIQSQQWPAQQPAAGGGPAFLAPGPVPSSPVGMPEEVPAPRPELMRPSTK